MIKLPSFRKTYTEKLAAFPCWDANAYYNLACFYSLNGEKEKALSNLEIGFKGKTRFKRMV